MIVTVAQDGYLPLEMLHAPHICISLSILGTANLIITVSNSSTGWSPPWFPATAVSTMLVSVLKSSPVWFFFSPFLEATGPKPVEKISNLARTTTELMATSCVWLLGAVATSCNRSFIHFLNLCTYDSKHVQNKHPGNLCNLTGCLFCAFLII